ncbi:hypothetical protein ABIF44_000931 [Bradyrhizobium japonicum]
MPAVGPRLGAVDARDVADDGIDDAAAARGVGWRRWGQQEVRHRDRVAETERVAAEPLHQHQRDAAAELALAITDREYERADDQPHRALGKSCQHPAQRFAGIGIDIAGDARDRQPDEPDRADRHRFKDESGDDGREHGKIVPLIGVETRRHRPQIDGQPHRERRDQLPAEPFCLRRLRASGHGPSPSIVVALYRPLAEPLLS